MANDPPAAERIMAVASLRHLEFCNYRFFGENEIAINFSICIAINKIFVLA
jgi:hypothetical protein